MRAKTTRPRTKDQDHDLRLKHVEMGLAALKVAVDGLDPNLGARVAHLVARVADLEASVNQVRQTLDDIKVGQAETKQLVFDVRQLLQGPRLSKLELEVKRANTTVNGLADQVRGLESLRGYGAETGNAVEKETALSQPGVVFWRFDGERGPYQAQLSGGAEW